MEFMPGVFSEDLSCTDAVSAILASLFNVVNLCIIRTATTRPAGTRGTQPQGSGKEKREKLF